MKTIEIRRHSIRSMDGKLTEQGLMLARLLGEEMGQFQRVITSPLPRAIQTAEAMGYEVNETADILAGTDAGWDLDCPFGSSFSEYAQAVRQNNSPDGFYANLLAAFYQKLAESLPEGGAALVINHSGVVEISAAACLPGANLDHLGEHAMYCEGIRLTWENGAFTAAEVLRV